MTHAQKILVVDDDGVTRTLLREVLEREGYQITTAGSGEEALQELKSDTYPIVLSDIRMLELDGLAVLRAAKRGDARTAVILMTGFGSMEGAVEAIQEGAFDYVSKPFKMQDLKSVVDRASRQWSVSSFNTSASSRIEVARGLSGRSPRMVEVYKTLARAALSNSHVLVIGERGTGKELVARSIHENSARKKAPFVVSDLLEEARGGTLFIEELSELSLATQARLERAIQTENVRVIGASRMDLEALVKAGRFREDLYYRLCAITIALPSLRERIEDLPELVNQFLARYAQKNGKSVSHISEEAMALLREYTWPGNVRELEHAIERAVALSSAAILFPEDFAIAKVAPAMPTNDESLEEVERKHIIRVLNEVQFNKSRASEVLGIDRATLYRKAQRYGIDLRAR